MTEDPAEPIAKTWKECVQPIVVKLEVARSLNLPTTFNPEGAKAMADLLKNMAKKLDVAVERERSANNDKT